MGGFEKTYREQVEPVFRYVLRLVGNREVAEDITAETFLELYRRGDSVAEDRLPAWLFVVARNRARDHWRRSLTERKFVRQAPEEDLTVAPETVFVAHLLESKALKPIHRLCLLLRYVQGMSRAEIAAHTALSETQIKGHLQYALQLLRKEMTLPNGRRAPAAEEDESER